MSDTRERMRSEASEKLQRALDQTRNREHTDRASVQREVDRLSRPSAQRASGDRPREVARERERLDTRADRLADRDRVKHEVERLCRDGSRASRRLSGSEERLHRLERVAERDPLRKAQGFDPRRVVEAERREIRATPEGFLSRHDGGFDRDTERDLAAALHERGRCG